MMEMDAVHLKEFSASKHAESLQLQLCKGLFPVFPDPIWLGF